ncbi:ATP-dependent zinc metalloprotease FtsH [Coprothermobacter platensis]|uniref:ATP-dependent zinc metalloprotease FtsH n=1 Tax=Coprothermobacter platensis TaxID=108819 RepID=UPI0003821FA9|nr:ATP-dependent zinc metalloprotease FtsH [Coprothermobacter platensis]
MKNNRRPDLGFLMFIILVFLVLALISPFFLGGTLTSSNTPVAVSTSEIVQMVKNGEIKSMVVVSNTSVKATGTDGKVYTADLDIISEQMLLDAAKDSPTNVAYSVQQEKTSIWITILGNWIPLLFSIFLLVFLFRQSSAGSNQVFSFTRSKARLYVEDKPTITFKDVAGAEEAKKDLLEIVDFLKNPKKYQVIGAKIPKGVLLVGPPGVGKTLMAKAVAGEAGVPFFSVSGSEFVEMFVGVGAARVRDLFEQARKYAPCIVFIDEIDAVGRERGAGIGGGHDEREQTLNQLLVEMDGFDPYAGIIVLAATNRPDILDPALLRPGRFDRKVILDMPDVNGRKQILLIHMRGKPIAPEVDAERLAQLTPGFSGADLANLVNEAALLAARKNKNIITMDEFEEAVEKVMLGPQRGRVLSAEEKKITAYHEIGHAVCTAILDNPKEIHKISIVPRGMAVGYVFGGSGEEKVMYTRDELIKKIAVLLGGRASEEVFLHTQTTGAENDIQRATDIARRMVVEWGMTDLGPVTLEERQDMVFLGREITKSKNYSEATAQLIDQKTKDILEEAYEMAKETLSERMERIHTLAQRLMEVETMSSDEFLSLISEG